MSSPFDVVDESFSQWKQPIVQQALSQVTCDVKGFFYYAMILFLNSYPTHMAAINCRLCLRQHHRYTVHYFMPVLAIYHRFHHHMFVTLFIIIIQ